jgi:lactoylglutathione lyase
MNIAHIAIWTRDLEKEKRFFLKYFECSSDHKYENKAKGFESYFIEFAGNCKIELMRRAAVPENKNDPSEENIGLSHLAISVGSKEAVDKITESIKKDGYTVISSPRKTGDGYYESCILDPEGNRIEITI